MTCRDNLLDVRYQSEQCRFQLDDLIKEKHNLTGQLNVLLEEVNSFDEGRIAMAILELQRNNVNQAVRHFQSIKNSTTDLWVMNMAERMSEHGVHPSVAGAFLIKLHQKDVAEVSPSVPHPGTL